MVNMTNEEKINVQIKEGNLDASKISDGYHTFLDLYKHRSALFVSLINVNHQWNLDEGKYIELWKSKLHSDGTMFPGGWFIAGIGENPGEQITYHLQLEYWDKINAPEREKAPLFDGHTPDDVVARLLEEFN